jgi:hypothetical protein
VSDHVARRRPEQPSLNKHDVQLVLERLDADDRFRCLSATDQHVLLVAVRKFMGGHGWWWHGRSVWAAEANVSTKTITRVTDNLVAVGLITKDEYRRPPRGSHPLSGTNGTKNYRLDPAIVGDRLLAVPVRRTRTRRDTESPRAEDPAVMTATRRDTVSPPAAIDTQGQGVPAERELAERRHPSKGSARRRGAPEPAAFTELLDGINVKGKGRAEARNEWRRDPALVAEVVRRWREDPRAGVGVFVLRLRDAVRLGLPRDEVVA